MSALKPRVAALVFLCLAALMGASRIYHFGPLPDASWAVFFAAGFYFGARQALVFAVLMAQAMLMDWVATRYMGVSAFCVTPAYWAIVPGYAALYWGGHYLRGQLQADRWDALRLLGCAVVAITLCYWVTNAAFYWWGGRYSQPHLAEYLQRFVQYLPGFLQTGLAYIAVIAAVHVAVLQVQSWRAARPA